jgi:hypothetical protein
MKLAKTDETGHSNVTKWLQDGCTLTAPQAAAVELVALGKNDTDTAKAAGVTRQTVNGWRNHDPAFIAAVNARRRELWEETHDRLRGLAVKALDVLAGALDADPATALPAAVQVLKALKIYGTVDAPMGPTSALGVLADRAKANALERLAAMPPETDGVEMLLREHGELPRLAGEEYDRLKAEWEARKGGGIA